MTASEPEVVEAAALANLMTSPLLSQLGWLRHGITRRVPGMGRADGNVAYSAPRDQVDGWAMRQAWCATDGLDAGSIVTVGQIHGSNVLRAEGTDAGTGARPGSGRLGLGDALITDAAGPVLMTLHADCLPVLLVDPGHRAVAAVHAGWRGSVAGVLPATVAAMCDAFGSRPADLLAFFGPAIGQCCYEVGGDVVSAWDASPWSKGERALLPAAERWRFDLRAANLGQFLAAGGEERNTDISPICTKCASGEWFSHRGQGAETGRFGALIAING